MNGFTIIDGEMFLWVSIRDNEKLHQDFPRKFDHLVAGGQVRFNFMNSFLSIFLSIAMQY